jgi:hypothetical protein
MAQAQLKNKVNMLKQENRRIWGRCATLQQNLEELKMIYKNQLEDTSDPQTQQQQVGTGSWVRLLLFTISH